MLDIHLDMCLIICKSYDGASFAETPHWELSKGKWRLRMEWDDVHIALN